jgi:uncharacterized protein
LYRITVRFYEELNDFLKKEYKKRDIDFSFSGRRSVKDLIESMGVPHVEVDLILVNGSSVDFSYIVENGDRISVYPEFETLSIGTVTRLRPLPLRNPRFVLDVHLRKLARRLRLMGFDVDYLPARDDAELSDISDREKRILLSRDRQLFMRKNISRGLYVRNTDPDLQIIEILNRLDLWDRCRPFSRCLECNGDIEPLDVNVREVEGIAKRIPPGVRTWCTEYYSCRRCERIYWRGSHFDKLRMKVDNIFSVRESGS